MVPDGIFKRRPNHNNTPESITLIIANFIVFIVAIQLFASCNKINTFFWIVLGALGVYNFFTIRKYREVFEKPQIIGYIASVVALIILFVLLRSRPQTC